jgi:hypothetical protein
MRDILDRCLEYLILVRRRLRFGTLPRGAYQVVVALVSLTGKAQPDRLDMSLPGLDAPSLRFRVAARNLRDEDAAATLERIAAGEVSRCLLGWISLMRGGGEAGIIRRWKQVAGTEPDGVLRANYAATVTTFAELTGREALWRSALEEWNMRESPFMNEVRAEGRAEGERHALLLVLGQKFGARVPQDLAAAIEAESDADVLSQWLTHAVTARSLKAFRSAIAH